MYASDAEKLEQICCPVCKSDDCEVVDERTGGGKHLRSVICRRCSHVYLNPRASQAAYDDFYRSGFSEGFNQIDDKESLVGLAASNDAKTARLIKFIAPHLRPGMKVLEIGAGYGNILAVLRDKHGASEVVGIEPDPIGQKVAHEVFGLDLLSGVLADHIGDFSDKKFDLIIMHHVLEHFLDPDEIGEALQKLCAEEGMVYVGVPNVCALTVPREFYFRFPHVQYFSPFSLFLFLWRSGFKVVDRKGFGQPLTLLACPIASAQPMLSWTEARAVSIPYRKVISRVRWGNMRQRARLFFRDKVKPVVPKGIKEMLKKALH